VFLLVGLRDSNSTVLVVPLLPAFNYYYNDDDVDDDTVSI
jgi:hypothetical protein